MSDSRETGRRAAEEMVRSDVSHGPDADAELSSWTVGALPIINSILKRLRLEGFLASYMPSTGRRARIAPERGLLILLKSVLLSRQPIYGVGEWAARYAPDLLGLTPEEVPALNDDRIGRCLDRLFDADRASLMLSVTEHVIREFGVSLEQLHVDSTTITFFGAYVGAKKGRTKRGKPTLAVVRGHNKDHRPDLKQILFLLTVTDDGGVPIYFEPGHGNLTDDKTHRGTWDLLCQITRRTDFLYVADSKLATRENMGHISGNHGRFVTILPRTRGEDSDFRTHIQTYDVTWNELYQRTDDEGEVVDFYLIADHPAVTTEGYRLLWLFSSSKQRSDKTARGDRIDRTLKGLAELRGRLVSPKSRYKDETKVRACVDAILAKHVSGSWIRFEIVKRETSSLKQTRPGRPSKSTKYTRQVKTRFDIKWELDPVAIAKDAATDGVFPLVSNDESVSDLELLLAYKRQPVIEKRFAQMKSDFDVAPVFLKEPARVEALACIYYFALLVQALVERQVRERMVEQELVELPLYPEGRACSAPCARRIFDLFKRVQRHELVTREGKTRLVTDLSGLQGTLLEFLDVSRAHYQ